MTNLERLKLHIKGITLETEEYDIYLAEANLTANTDYDPTSNTNKRNILKSALNILEDIANNPNTMKNMKQDDISVSQFHENLQNRIDHLQNKIAQIPDDSGQYTDGATVGFLFSY